MRTSDANEPRVAKYQSKPIVPIATGWESVPVSSGARRVSASMPYKYGSCFHKSRTFLTSWNLF